MDVLKMFPTYINLCATGTYGLAAQDIILRQKQEKGQWWKKYQNLYLNKSASKKKKKNTPLQVKVLQIWLQ